MYRHEEVKARVGQMSPVLRGLVEEMLRRGEQLDYCAPVDEALDSDLEAQLQLVLSEPALRQEWEAFFQAIADAAYEDAAAVMRGEHDHELYQLVGHLTRVPPFLQDGPASADRPPCASSASSHSVPSLASAISSCRPTATPLKRRRILVPSSRHRLQPLDDLFGLLGIVPFQCPPGKDPLHRLAHVQPAGSQRRVEHHDSSCKHP